MQIKEIKIENFKGVRKLYIKDLTRVNVFIGKNNSGKSSILEALNSFFSNKYFQTGLKPPPTLVHYDKDGKAYPETKISLKFSLSENFFKELLDKDVDQCKRAEELYKNEIWVAKIKFSEDGDQNNLPQFYKIEGVSNDDPAFTDRIDKLILDKIKMFYTGNHQTRFISAIDGCKINQNLEQYYQFYTGGSENRDFRVGLKTIIARLENLLRSDEKHQAHNFLLRLKQFAPQEFAQFLDIRGSDQLVTEFGKEESLQSTSFYGQGDGEIDSLELFWVLDDLSFGQNKNTCHLYIIDEPENHKHASLQRKFLNLIIERAEDRQFFICTQSPTFASRYRDSKVRVYLITKNIEDDTNQAKSLLESSTKQETKTELGLLNIDYFFSNAILFIEGETEEEVMPALLEFYNTSESALGLKIHNMRGVDKVNYERLKETFVLLKDTNIVPFILLDKEGNAEAERGKILKSHGDLFNDPEIQYRLWVNQQCFIDSLPREIVVDAFNNLLKDKGYNKNITDNEIEEAKKSNSTIEKFIETNFYQITKSSFKDNKRSFGRYIADRIKNISLEEKERFNKNEVFKYVKSLIEKIKQIN